MMTSLYSFGMNNGTQVGVNNGVVTAKFILPDITTTRSLARSLLRSFSTSTDLFKQVQNELALLLAALDIADGPSPLGANELYSSVKDDLHNCQANLNRLREMKVNYDSLDPEVTESKDLETELIEQLADIKSQLSSFTTTLSLINTQEIRSSQEHVKRVLEEFFKDGKSRSKAKTIVSNGSTSDTARENWRQLRKELQDADISPESFSEHLDLIISILKKSGVVDDTSDINTITEYTIGSESTAEHLLDPVLEMRPMPIASKSESGTERTPNMQAPSESVWQIIFIRLVAFIVMVLQIEGPSNSPEVKLSNPAREADSIVLSAEKGDLSSLIAKLEEGMDINTSNTNGDSLLSIAAAKGHKEAVIELLDKGANPGAINQKQEASIVQAARHGMGEILNILMSRSDSFDDSQYHMALSVAAENGHRDIITILLDYGVDLNRLDAGDENDNTALFKAADNGHGGVIRLLLERGAQVYQLNFWNESALFAACRSDHELAARLLIKSGAYFDSKARDIVKTELFHTIQTDVAMVNQINNKRRYSSLLQK